MSHNLSPDIMQGFGKFNIRSFGPKICNEIEEQNFKNFEFSLL